MTHPAASDPFRQAAEAEGGMPVSAGARLCHGRATVGASRTIHIDVSGVPDDGLPALVAEIEKLVSRAVKPANGPARSVPAHSDAP